MNALDQFDSERPIAQVTPPAQAGGEAYLSGDLLNAFLGTTEYASRRIYRVTTSGAELIPFTVTRPRKKRIPDHFRQFAVRMVLGFLIAVDLIGIGLIASLIWR
jgi:hypothetical protein